MKKTWLIAGLGNPEGKYFQTYHNVGFLTAEAMAAQSALAFKKKGNQLICEHGNFYLLKPLTYMNLSGQAVAAAARKYKIAPENIIVFVDDLYIEKGTIRVGLGGSHAGHNGIKSITEILGTNQYIKIRMGIKPAAAPKSGTANYVLSKMDTESRTQIDAAIEKATAAAAALTSGEPLLKVQSLFNTKQKPETENTENNTPKDNPTHKSAAKHITPNTAPKNQNSDSAK